MLIAQTCLLIASKSAETLRKARDVINSVYHVLNPNEILKLDDRYYDLRYHLLENEQYFLRVLGFDFEVELPYNYLLNYLKSLKATPLMAQVAWNIVNDSFCTTLCVEYPPYVIAVAAIFLALKLLNSDDSPEKNHPQGSKKKWWEAFGVTYEQLNDCGARIVQLYLTSCREEDLFTKANTNETKG
jgi:hypothetical protein